MLQRQKNKFLLASQFFLCGILLLSSCQKVEEFRSSAKDALEKGKQVSQVEQEISAKKADRKQRGDTTAIPFLQLIAFLPPNITGYNALEPRGAVEKVHVYEYTTAKRRFESQHSRNGFLEVEISDFNQTYDLFGLTAAWMKFSFSKETDTGFERTFVLENSHSINCYEKYDKNTNTADVTYAIAHRFIIHVRANEQKGTELVRQIGESMPLAELEKR